MLETRVQAQSYGGKVPSRYDDNIVEQSIDINNLGRENLGISGKLGKHM